MADHPQTGRDWRSEAEAWRAKAEHLQATVDRLRSMAAAGEAAGFLAHELNNLFTPVVGYCQAAQGEDADEAIKAKALKKALAAAERVGEVSRAILELAGSVAGELNEAESDVAVSVDAAMLVVGSERWGREGIKVKVDVPRGTFVAAAPGVVQQVVMNLVLNARRAMKGRSGRLSVWVREVGGMVRMEVRDEGAGMSGEVMGRSLGITSSDDDGRDDQLKVDVDELAKSGSINGQARWGVRLREIAKAQMAKLPNEEGKNIARLRGAKVAASMSPIRVWDAAEVAEEMRGKRSRDQGIKGREDREREGGGGNAEARSSAEDAESRSGGQVNCVGTDVVETDNGRVSSCANERLPAGGHNRFEAPSSASQSLGTFSQQSWEKGMPLSATTGATGGTGLGLALCLELVGRVGGRITAQSKVGEGTVVRVEWPAAGRAKRAA